MLTVVTIPLQKACSHSGASLGSSKTAEQIGQTSSSSTSPSNLVTSNPIQNYKIDLGSEIVSSNLQRSEYKLQNKKCKRKRFGSIIQIKHFNKF